MAAGVLDLGVAVAETIPVNAPSRKAWILAPVALGVVVCVLCMRMPSAPSRSLSRPPPAPPVGMPPAAVHAEAGLEGRGAGSAGPAPARRWLISDHDAGEEGLQAVPDEWIVTVRKGASTEALASRLGATVVGRMPVGGTYRLRFPDAASAAEARRALEGDPSVLGIESNYIIPRPAVPVPAATDPALASGVNLSPVSSETPIVIGLVDTAVGTSGGIQEGFLLGSSVLAPVPTHGNSVVAAILDGLAAAAGERAASAVRILPVDVYGGAPETTSYQVAEGILAAMEQGATVVNLSLGTSAPVRLVQDLIDAGDELGVVFVGAAGNEPVATPTYPAAYDPVLAVTSMDGSGRVADDVNHGAFVDVGAPGTVRFPYGDGWYMAAGTSISAGFVSGLTAGLAERTGISVTEAKEQIARMLAVEPGP